MCQSITYVIVAAQKQKVLEEERKSENITPTMKNVNYYRVPCDSFLFLCASLSVCSICYAFASRKGTSETCLQLSKGN